MLLQIFLNFGAHIRQIILLKLFLFVIDGLLAFDLADFLLERVHNLVHWVQRGLHLLSLLLQIGECGTLFFDFDEYFLRALYLFYFSHQPLLIGRLPAIGHQSLLELLHAFLDLVCIIVDWVHVLPVLVKLSIHVLHLLVEHFDLAQLLFLLSIDDVKLTEKLVQFIFNRVFAELARFHEASGRVLLRHQVLEFLLQLIKLLIQLGDVQVILRVVRLLEDFGGH